MRHISITIVMIDTVTFRSTENANRLLGITII